MLSTPARVTSACQQVASAVNDLRLTAHSDGDVALAEPEQLHRIEGLKRCSNERWVICGVQTERIVP